MIARWVTVIHNVGPSIGATRLVTVGDLSIFSSLDNSSPNDTGGRDLRFHIDSNLRAACSVLAADGGSTDTMRARWRLLGWPWLLTCRWGSVRFSGVLGVVGWADVEVRAGLRGGRVR